MAPGLSYRGLQNAANGATISGSAANGLLRAGNQSQKTSSKIKLAYVVSLPNYNFVKKSLAQTRKFGEPCGSCCDPNSGC